MLRDGPKGELKGHKACFVAAAAQVTGRLLYYCMCGVVWYGMAWCGVVWCGVEWSAVEPSRADSSPVEWSRVESSRAETGGKEWESGRLSEREPTQAWGEYKIIK